MRPTWESWVKVMKYIWSVSQVHFIESCSWIRFVTTNWWCQIMRIVKERDALWCLCWKSPSLSLKRSSKYMGESWGFLASSWGGIDGNTWWSVRMYLQTPASPTRLGAHWHPHELTLPFCSKRGGFQPVRYSTALKQTAHKSISPLCFFWQTWSFEETEDSLDITCTDQ